MNSDIRIPVTFRDHRKRRRLTRLIGLGATHYLLNLWISAALEAPDGVLRGWSEEDIKEAAQWPEDAHSFVQALTDCGQPQAGFLEVNTEGVYCLHHWADHQPFVIHAGDRSERARKAAAARWGSLPNGETDAGGNAPSNATGNATGNAPSPTPPPDPFPPPDPHPSPLPSPRREVGATTNLLSPDGDLAGAHGQIVELFNRICSDLPRVKVLSDIRRRKLLAGWKEHPDIAWWSELFEMVQRSDFLMGRGDGKWKASFDWLMEPTNMTKVVEGNYNDKVRTRNGPSSRSLPTGKELRESWKKR